MTQRCIVIFDASPINEPTDWMVDACKQLNLTLLDADSLADAVSQQPVSIDALSQQLPGVGVHYLNAFEQVAKGKTRIALNSLIWLKHGLQGVAGVVASLDQIEPRIAAEVARSPVKLDPKLVADETKRIKSTIEAMVASVPKDLLHVVQGSDAQKTQAAVAFLKPRCP